MVVDMLFEYKPIKHIKHLCFLFAITSSKQLIRQLQNRLQQQNQQQRQQQVLDF